MKFEVGQRVKCLDYRQRTIMEINLKHEFPIKCKPNIRYTLDGKWSKTCETQNDIIEIVGIDFIDASFTKEEFLLFSNN